VSPTGRPELLRRAVAEGMHVAVINGDAEVPARFFGEVTSGIISSWIVVEQDVLPRSVEAYRQASAHQQENRQYLRARGW